MTVRIHRSLLLVMAACLACLTTTSGAEPLSERQIELIRRVKEIQHRRLLEEGLKRDGGRLEGSDPRPRAGTRDPRPKRCDRLDTSEA